MTQPNYPLRFLERVHFRMQSGTPAETARWAAKKFLQVLYHQNPSLELQPPHSDFSPDISFNDRVAADIYGNPILINNPRISLRKRSILGDYK